MACKRLCWSIQPSTTRYCPETGLFTDKNVAMFLSTKKEKNIKKMAITNKPKKEGNQISLGLKRAGICNYLPSFVIIECFASASIKIRFTLGN